MQASLYFWRNHAKSRNVPNSDTRLQPVRDALNRTPQRTSVLLRKSWPLLKEFLDAGHTIRELHEALRDGGISIHYSNLCHYLAQLRNAAGESPRTPRRSGDPLENVRRLTERDRPGFQFESMPSAEKLVGRK
jgi:hypothetical protein